MADFGKPPAKKKASRLGAPPLEGDVSTTLSAPEHAPLAAEGERKARGKTGRTITFGTRVTPEFDQKFRELAFQEKKKHVELLEDMLECYMDKK